jgi:tetratricopeptide (TPR) repeat protein
MLKNISGLLVVLLFTANSFAGELVSKEAVNYYNEGLKLQRGGDFVKADSFYQKALLVDKYDNKWQKYIANNRGVMLAEQGFLEEAEEYFKQALKIDQGYLSPKLNLGFIYEKRRTELESIKYWLKVLNINLDEVKPKGFVLGVAEETKVSK